jgi:hypothetical protein
LIVSLQKGKLKLWRFPKNRRFYGKMECLSLWPTYVGEKGRTLGKTYGIKARCYWERPWGTHWEPIGHIKNLIGTCWEPRKKKKESKHFESMMSLPIGFGVVCFFGGR